MKVSKVGAAVHEDAASMVASSVSKDAARGCAPPRYEWYGSAPKFKNDQCSEGVSVGVPHFPTKVVKGGHQPECALVSKLFQRPKRLGRAPKFKSDSFGQGSSTRVQRRFGDVIESYLHAEVSFSNVLTHTPSLYLVTPHHTSLSPNFSFRPQPKLHGASLPSGPPQARRRRRGRHKRGGLARRRCSTPAAPKLQHPRAHPVRAQATLGVNHLLTGTTVRSRGQLEDDGGLLGQHR